MCACGCFPNTMNDDHSGTEINFGEYFRLHFCTHKIRRMARCGRLFKMRMPLLELCVLLSVQLVRCSEFGEVFAKWSTTCREDNRCSKNEDGSDYLTNIVPWTLTTDTIHQFDSGKGSPHCKSVHELVETITHPVANYTCQLPWLSNEEICSLLDQYSVIFWSGDSLMRHMTQALYILLTQDLQYGGFPPQSNTSADVPHKYCSCDGQFSESKICRNYKQVFSFTDMTAQLGVCPQLRDKLLKTEFAVKIQSARHPVSDTNMFVRPPSHRCVNDSRPMFFFIEGGAHYLTDAPVYINDYLRPTLRNIHYYARSCHTLSVEDGQPLPYKVHIAASGLSFASDALVKQRPHYSQDTVASFYLQLDTFFKQEYPQVALLNFVSLTKEGTQAGRGDGFHSLTDINLIKAQIALNTLKLFLQEER